MRRPLAEVRADRAALAERGREVADLVASTAAPPRVRAAALALTLTELGRTWLAALAGLDSDLDRFEAFLTLAADALDGAD